MPTREFARARVAVTIMFIINAVGWASLLPRYPELKVRLGLDELAWGTVVGIGPVGGLLAGLCTAHLIRRYRSAVVWFAATIASLGCLALLAAATHWSIFLTAIVSMSACDALADISMNAHGLQVQQGYGRTIVNGLHGWWSAGAVGGGALGALSVQFRVPLVAHCVIVFAALIVASIFAYRRSLPQHETPDQPKHAGRGIPRQLIPRLVALGLLGATAGLIEDAGASWGAVYLAGQFTVAPFVVGMGFVCLQGAQLTGRFLGDWLTERIGGQAAVLQGGISVLAGMGLAVLWPTPATTLIGFACAGWGVATVIPNVMHAADQLPGMAASNGLTFVTWLIRLGFFAGPPLIGLVAQTLTLRWALAVLPIAALLMLALSPAMTVKQQR